eukprot:UN25536
MLILKSLANIPMSYSLATHLFFFPFFPSPGQKATALTAASPAARSTNCFIIPNYLSLKNKASVYQASVTS